jgi:glycerophosphoryl diester phosphodiesterase
MYHRGGGSLGPENTVAAIHLAFLDGADAVEIDVQGTLDQELVLMHDLTVDRTTDGTGAVTSLSLAEIKQLDAGSWFGSEFAGEPVPTLAEALFAIQTYAGQVLFDRRPGAEPARIAAVLAGAQFAHEDVWLFETSLQQVPILDSALPGARIVFVPLPGVVFDQAFLATLAGAGVWGVSLTREEMLTQAFVDMLHSTGLSAYRLEALPSFDAHFRDLQIGVDVVDTASPAIYRQALAAIPEPSSAALLASGLILLALQREARRGRCRRSDSAGGTG